jgi:drug/metabolite transporter (DMT)-like permease
MTDATSRQHFGHAHWAAGVFLSLFAAFLSAVAKTLLKAAHNYEGNFGTQAQYAPKSTNDQPNGISGQPVASRTLNCETKGPEMTPAERVAAVAEGMAESERVGFSCLPSNIGDPRSYSKSQAATTLTIATIIFIAGPIMDMFALRWAPQSVVSATAGTTSAWSLVFAAVILREPWGKYDVAGTCLIVLGCIGVGIFGPKTTPHYRFDEIIDLFQAKPFLQFTVCVVLWLISVVTLINCPRELVGRKIHRLAWGTVSGTIGGLFFFTKCLLAFIDDGLEPWHHWQSWAIAVGALASSGGGILLLNEGLRRYDAVFMTPAYQGCLVMMGSISGIVFFQELKDFSSTRRMIFAAMLGLIFIGLGLCLMSHSNSETSNDGLDEPRKNPGNPQDPLESVSDPDNGRKMVRGEKEITLKRTGEIVTMNPVVVSV